MYKNAVTISAVRYWVCSTGKEGKATHAETVSGKMNCSGLRISRNALDIEFPNLELSLTLSNFKPYVVGFRSQQRTHSCRQTDEHLFVCQSVRDLTQKPSVIESYNSKNASQSAKEYISHSEDKKNSNQEIETKELKSGILHYEINSNEGIDVKKFDIDTTYLEHDQKIKISALLNDYKHIFAKDKYDIGQVKNYEAFIDLQVEKYCSKRPYRCSLDDKKEIEKQIEQLLKNELIEESYSPFAAPVTLAFKRDEGKKSRLCIDFRDLNKIIIPQPQPFPLIEDLLEHLKHLSKLLDAIAEEGFRLKLTKCKFAAQSVRFLGHIVEGNTITPLKDNLRSIAEFPAPQNKKQIRQFLDHKPLENLNIKNRTDDELGDMTHYLSQYNFVIKYNPEVSVAVSSQGQNIGLRGLLLANASAHSVFNIRSLPDNTPVKLVAHPFYSSI
ncbi:hypothetical protein EVAR_18682_1 [Eumeta japonica]|uniref:Uncharacterized protein n=1 Tax=Eumeta variegata TaxID=151549 RepID=A0A4C1U6T6_EUMVA|nr:hypothetical protein EVAR_18682_1 [Eumeta japonica]